MADGDGVEPAAQSLDEPEGDRTDGPHRDRFADLRDRAARLIAELAHLGDRLTQLQKAVDDRRRSGPASRGDSTKSTNDS